ncbi:hypothetical protein GALL_308580 [mine drainage metagenome]|jgi:hypothetical protein|uniref:DUF6036 domain-containing protein n=1 Tax=mine drainage metagenome TaxID=410659 RepID=A0A1J5QUF6_9ZZZZ
MTEDVYPTFSAAIFVLFQRFSDALKLREASSASTRAYLFGGGAVHLYAGSRFSSDLDLDISGLEAAVSRADVRNAIDDVGYVLYAYDEGTENMLEIDRNYNTTFGPLHEDYESRATLLWSREDAPLVVMLPSREDLAVTKLGRFADHDIADILLLLGDPAASWEVFERLAREASMYYVGNTQDLTSKLNYLRSHMQGGS